MGFTALTFFAVTGITLNHPSWFGGDFQKVTDHEGQLPREWLALPAGSTTADEQPPENQVARLEIVEHLRTKEGVRGAVSEFRVDDAECMVIFKGPGYAADAIVDRHTGSYRLTKTMMGTVAILNDLHKGRDSGQAWSLLIDVSALMMVFVSVTGIVLLLYLKRKRFSGLLTAVAGTVLVAVVYWLWVP